jgi:translation initiation factor IF-1
VTKDRELEVVVALLAVVERELPRGLYAVRSDDGRRFTASLPIKSKHAIVSLLRGDRVMVEVSGSDTTRARIVRKVS